MYPPSPQSVFHELRTIPYGFESSSTFNPTACTQWSSSEPHERPTTPFE